MVYVLYGSKTSPFVRRIRILLDQAPYEFRELNVFDTQDYIELNKINPVNQVPLLIDGEKTIWDSRFIFNYLNSKNNYQKMGWDDENLLTAIDGAMTSGVTLLMLKRSGVNIDEPSQFVVRQKDRIESVLDYLKPFLGTRALNQWDFQAISLYCFLDWAVFRGIIKIDQRPECQAFLSHYKNLPGVQSTAIPKV